MRLVRGFFAVATLALVAPARSGASSLREVGAELTTQVQSVPVPKVVGLQLSNALRMLDNLRFGRGEVQRVSHPEPSGQVIDQLPPAGSRVPPGTKVNLVVSTGPASQPEVSGDQPSRVDSATVPGLIGQTQLSAAILLAIAKLSMGQTQTVPDEANDGKVVRQFPEAGARVPRNMPVALWLGKAAPVQVPDLRDSTIAGAAAALQSAGLKLGKVDSNLADAGTRLIVRQQPGAGKTASRGSAVRVWYSYPREPVAPPPAPPPPPPPPVRVPSVVGNTLARAIDILRGSELDAGPVDSVETEQAPGHVLFQQPKAGDLVQRNTRVALQVAVQSKYVKVPDVTKVPPAAARNRLEQVGLRLGAVTPIEREGGNGLVVLQAPFAGATVLRGTVVSVRISVPLEAIPVPNVVGSRLGLAREALRGAKFIMGTITPGTPTSADSTVVAQSPGAGASVSPATAVDLTLATERKVPPRSPVPNVVGRGHSEADSILRAAGFVSGTITPVESTNVGRDTVISQNPAANTPAAPGSAVSLQVAAPRQPPPPTVPNVVGLSTAAAESLLGSARFGAQRASEPSGPGQRGTVLRQDPPAGSVVPAGTIVRLTIGDWPPVWLIVLLGLGAVVGIGAGVAGVHGWNQHQVNQKWQKRVTLEAESLPGAQAVPDDAGPLAGPELTIGANPGQGSQEVVGDGPSIGESRT